MRGGSANNIYVIPAPEKLDFGMAMLLAAACCIPAILSLNFMPIKILDNREGSDGDEGEEHARSRPEETLGCSIGRSNSANSESIEGVIKVIQFFFTFVEIPVFAGAVLAILIIGELNFWSQPVKNQIEPFASICI
jgi:hypothetical protein